MKRPTPSLAFTILLVCCASPTIAASPHSVKHPPSPSSPTSPPPPPSTPPPPSNRAATALNLIHVPLKNSCEILRMFYNSSGGTYWSNQDGWQYVDSVILPNVPTGGSYSHIHLDPDQRPTTPHVPPIPQKPSSDSSPSLSTPDSSMAAIILPVGSDTTISSIPSRAFLSSRALVDDHAQDRDTSAPSAPPDQIPDDDEEDENPDPSDSTEPGTNPNSDLDPNNCCGWYGVVCIGPDGVIPPPWPPYDEDLISSRFAASASSVDPPALSRGLHKRDQPQRNNGKSLFRKRREPYYPYHGRPHHSSHGHGHGNSGQSDDWNYNDDVGTGEHRKPRKGHPPHPPAPRTGGHSDGHHVEQADDWYIIELHLGFNGLTGPVPEILSKLVNLMILDISNNELTGEIPASYGNLTRIKRLDVSSNKITGKFPDAVTKMVNIQELVLKNNYLTGPLPPSVLKLKQITELSLANNEFDGMLPQGLFAALQKLRVVNLNQNAFSGEIGSDIGGLAGLIKFSARANEFSGKIPPEFGHCQALATLNLGANRLTGEIPESLYGLQSLKVLDLPDNKLSGQISPKIGNMISMTKLILSHNNFSGPLPVEIQNMTRLEFMVLNYNRFDGLFPAAVAPPQINVCLVQPNFFSGCPLNASVQTSTTLAYQCNLDCRERVLHPELYDALTGAAANHTAGQILCWRFLFPVLLVIPALLIL